MSGIGDQTWDFFFNLMIYLKLRFPIFSHVFLGFIYGAKKGGNLLRGGVKYSLVLTINLSKGKTHSLGFFILEESYRIEFLSQ